MKNENATPTIKHDGQLSTPHGGLTLRDYFAAKAMQGLLSGFYRDTSKYNFSELPTESYSIADAMLSERNK